MIKVRRNPLTNNYDVPISVDEWIDILSSLRENSNILDALEKWYLAPGHTSSFKELGLKWGKPHQYFGVQNMMLGQAAIKRLNRFAIIGDEDKETFWGVPLILINQQHNVYTCRLRPELVEAIEKMGLFSENSKKQSVN
ncbi:MAG: hypothetical protein Q4D04_02135 [Clostridia bacterium]|nr:hypothetical protein [Clostridia bacterium]